LCFHHLCCCPFHSASTFKSILLSSARDHNQQQQFPLVRFALTFRLERVITFFPLLKSKVVHWITFRGSSLCGGVVTFSYFGVFRGFKEKRVGSSSSVVIRKSFM
jgi:hypothetical protein